MFVTSIGFTISNMFIALWNVVLIAALAWSAPTKLKCTHRELKAKDCHLQSPPFQVNLLEATVSWNDGTWRTVEGMPLKGEGVEWELVGFELHDGWPILQMRIWDRGVGESNVQSLHWFVLDLSDRHLKTLAEGVVRKRHTPPPAGEDAAVNADVKTKKTNLPKTLLERPEDAGMKWLGKDRFEWHVGRQRKVIERERNGI